MEESNYNKAIRKLRQERKEARDKIVQVTSKIDGILNSLALDEGEREISWKQMKSIVKGIRFDVNKDVYFIKVYEDENKMSFKVYLNADGEFGLQTHDCLEETTVLKGNLIDANNPEVIYGIGETKTWQPGELHKPICTLKSIWEATKTKI